MPQARIASPAKCIYCFEIVAGLFGLQIVYGLTLGKKMWRRTTKLMLAYVYGATGGVAAYICNIAKLYKKLSLLFESPQPT